MTELIEYMKMCAMNTSGSEQDKCMKILRILEKRRCMKNAVLKTITIISAIVFVLSVIALDSESYVPFYTALVSGLWLLLFAIANQKYV